MFPVRTESDASAKGDNVSNCPGQDQTAESGKKACQVDLMNKFDALLDTVKVCNRASFLHAWRERTSKPNVSRFMGSKGSRSHSSATAHPFPNEKPVDEDALLDTSSDEDCPPHQNERRLDAFRRMNNSEHLQSLCSWMYDTRRRYGCRVRASDWDISNGVMLLETLHILLPELFDCTGQQKSEDQAMEFEIDLDLDREGYASRSNVDRVIDAMGRFVFYDYYGNGRRINQLKFHAVHEDGDWIWHLPSCVFTMAYHGPKRDNILMELELLDDLRKALLFEVMNKVLSKIGAEKAQQWKTMPNIVPDPDDRFQYPWLMILSAKTSQSEDMHTNQDDETYPPSKGQRVSENDGKNSTESHSLADEQILAEFQLTHVNSAATFQLQQRGLEMTDGSILSLTRDPSDSIQQPSSDSSQNDRLAVEIESLHKQLEEERKMRSGLEVKLEIMEKEKQRVALLTQQFFKLVEYLTKDDMNACIEVQNLRQQLCRIEEHDRKDDKSEQ